MGFTDFAAVKAANTAFGHFWFAPDPQREHRIESPLIAGRYWIESQWADFDQTSRVYQAVEASDDGSIRYLFDAQRFDGIDAAHSALNNLTAGAANLDG